MNQKISNQELLEIERPWIAADSHIMSHMSAASYRIMNDDNLEIEFRVHAMELYLEIEKELGLRN